MNKLRRTCPILALSALTLFAAMSWPGRLKGEQDRPTKAVQAEPQSPAKNLKITLRTGKNQDLYEIGETIKFMFRTNRDCFVTLFDIGTDGSVVQLFPNKAHPDNRVRHDRTYEIPPPKAGFRLRVQGPQGVERVIAVATLKPLASPTQRALKSQDLFPSLDNPRATPREFRDNVVSLGPSGWAQSRLKLRVVISRADVPPEQSGRSAKDRSAERPGRSDSNATPDLSPAIETPRRQKPPARRPVSKPSLDESEKPPAREPAREKSDGPPESGSPKKPEAKGGRQSPKKNFRLLAVSLRVLQAKLKECTEKGACPNPILRFCGMRRVLGYVLDGKNKDIVIVGRGSGSTPALHVEDLAVALRNVWDMDQAPGCSIDPDATVMNELRKLNQDKSAKPGTQKFKRTNRSWEKICSGLQSVRVMGVPFDSRFAKVMVDADYYMKRLVNGSVTLGIDGFNSLTGLTLDVVRRDLKRGDSVSIPPMIHNRFWFAAGDNSFLSDEGAIWIKESKVILLTEEEFLTKTGEIRGRGRPNQLARKFCELFSEKYGRIAKKRPIYAELENLFRLVALIKTMKHKGAQQEAGLNMQYLLTGYPVGKTPVERSFPGLSNFSEIRQHKGRMIYRFCLRSCGGVAMAPAINDRVIRPDVRGTTRVLRHDVIKSRPSGDALSWEVVTRSAAQ
jgi:hypothetical protein